jgi:muramoyltetrapeptide carboxypeptidase
MISSITLQDAIRPQALRPGDTLAIISPAASSAPHQFAEGMAYLEQLELHPRLMPHTRKQLHYLAGTDEERLADLHDAFADPEVKGIISARGGYGCMRLLPHLNWDLIRANPKVLIGFSDLTSLLLPIYQHTGLITFHGPMLTSNLIEGDPYTREQLWKLVMDQVEYPYTVPNASQYTCLRPGICEGRLIGGNLSLLAALCGTPYQPDTRGAILFIEDWHEQFYSLDRQFMQLRLAGMFDNIAGLLLCDFTEMEDSWEGLSLTDFFRELTAFLQVPVGYGFSVGHGDQTATFPVGASVRLDTATGRLEILSAPVDRAGP